ncbi:hypothetical protein PoB_001022000 [Plakobranchus ocellatus]|uniref:Uncharacterized protein n=1 Tax=Plakobranchus ocellatus TaxID=259542 RepID=A0AAV3YLW5_9GAST|nr:hypothetical protein PoB_001022000 [Plakobranchus ocellatus]
MGSPMVTSSFSALVKLDASVARQQDSTTETPVLRAGQLFEEDVFNIHTPYTNSKRGLFEKQLPMELAMNWPQPGQGLSQQSHQAVDLTADHVLHGRRRVRRC